MKQQKNRWLIATCAVGIHISIGSVYAWSVFTNPLKSRFGWDDSEIAFTFSLAILFLGLSAAFLGHFVEKYGPRKAGILAAVIFGIGVTGSGFAVHLGSLVLLYLFYGVLGGIGLGVGYIAPVSTLVKWFPDRRGLATGLAIMGFGFASPMAQEITGMSAFAAASMVGLMGLFNGFGRIGWASLSDVIGRPNTYTAFFLIQLAAFFLLPHTTHPLLFQILIFLILTCYGGGFSSIPAYIGDLFGTRELGATHGYILTAWAAAGLAGPSLTSLVRETTGSYTSSLTLFAGLFIIALILSIWIRSDIRKTVSPSARHSA